MAEDVFGIVGSTQAGAFRVDEVVAEGGFAVIYRAYHGAFRASVALKCLKVPRTLSDSEQKEFLERFREEAELLFRLSSATPSVVRPLHVGTLTMTDRRFVPFIALEWLEGDTLDKVISTRALGGLPPMDLRTAVKLLTPVADALSRAHRFPTANGGTVAIVHRDLKPENVFIAKVHGRDVAKVLDFGIAKVKSVTTEMVGRQSAAESVISAFTPAYGAPEQWLPKRYGQTGPWTDVWGLAITVVEAVCGHAPIDGDHAAMMGSAIDPIRRPSPRNEGARISEEAEAVFVQALAVDPRDRFHDVAGFWNALCRSEQLPELAVERPLSAAPPAETVRVAGRADPRGHTAIDPSRGQETMIEERRPGAHGVVPDLVGPPPRSSGRAPPFGPSSSPPSGRGQVAPPPKASSRVADPNALFGSTFDLDDDDGPPRRIDMAGGIGGIEVQSSLPLPPRPQAPSYAHVVRPPEASSAKLELAGPIKLVVLAVVLMAVDWSYAAFTGEILHYGAARMLWVAGPILLLGIVQLAQRLLAAGD